MKTESILSNEQTQTLVGEIRQIIARNFEDVIAAQRARRRKAQVSFDRILDLPTSGLPIKEAAEILGLSVPDLKEFLFEQHIPYMNRQGDEFVSAGLFSAEVHDRLGIGPAYVSQHAMMILTRDIDTDECKEIMGIVDEAYDCLMKKGVLDY
jgi:hypothetical protein